jgi:hypothetical protein
MYQPRRHNPLWFMITMSLTTATITITCPKLKLTIAYHAIAITTRMVAAGYPQHIYPALTATMTGVLPAGLK